MDNNFYFYDSINNKNVKLTSSSDGKLNVKNIEKSLKAYRREGKCFFASVSSSTGIPLNYLLTLWNPAGSGYTAGLYNVLWNTSTKATTGNAIKYSLYTLDGITFKDNPTFVNRRNVNLGEADDADIGVYSGIQGTADDTSIHGTLMSSYLVPSSSSGGLWHYLDIQEEIIEIPEGFGLTMRLEENSSRLNVHYSVTFRYIKVPNSEQL